MQDLKYTLQQKAFWTKRYEANQTGWDIGYPSTPLKAYIDQLSNKDLKILIPGAGNAYEAEYLFQQGFKNTYVLDISEYPLRALKQRVPAFPINQLLLGNFFEHVGKYDLILEQTFFCSFEPTIENRQLYAQKMADLLVEGGKLVGVWFDIPLVKDVSKRPFGGTKVEYLGYLSPYFQVQIFEPCYNSIKPRMGNELFGIFVG
ncbi:MAG: methyltransferase domain-containing protein [Bacteroidota bacterium]